MLGRPFPAVRWVVLVGAMAMAACAPVELDGEGPTTTAAPVDPSGPTSVTSGPTETTTPGGLAGLRVGPEGSDAGYERRLFQPNGWDDLDGDGCDTRAEVLIRESRTPPEVGRGCTVIRGDWLSIYDGYATPDPGELEIDHVVALSEAWRSGAASWPEDRRLAFTQDEENLIAVTAATNRSKGDRDPAEWQPPNRGSWCAFTQRWIDTKVRWGLTADDAELRALGNLRRDC